MISGRPDPAADVTGSDAREHQRSEHLRAARSRLVAMADGAQLEDVLRATLDELERLTGSRIGFYHFVEPDQATLSLQAWSTATEREYCRAEGKGHHYAIDAAGVWADALRSGQATIHNDYARLAHRHGLPPGHAELERELVVPVTHNGRFVAILGVGNKPTPYTDTDLDVVRQFAELAWEIVERKRATEELHLKDAAIDAALNAVALIDLEGRLRYVNRSFCQLWRLDNPGPVLGRPVGELWVEPPAAPAVLAALTSPAGVRGELEGRRADGSSFRAEYAAALVLSPAGAPVRVTASFVDVTARKTAEARLHAAAEAWQVMLDASLDGYWMTDATGRILEANETYARMSGYTVDELTRMSIPDLEAAELPEQTATHLKNLFAVGFTRFETAHRHRDGTAFPVEISASVARDAQRLLVFVRDLRPQRAAESERRRLASHLERSQRLQSLGSLAGGIAHDMNNVLGAILGVASAHVGTLAETDPLRRDLETINGACVRGRALVRGLLDFSRQKLAEEHDFALNVLVREEIALLARTTLQRVRLVMELQEPLPTLRGDPGAIAHALMNLCVNAVEAMPDGGVLTITTRSSGSDRVELRITDTGHGMPSEVLERALDPFFTTKVQGQGTGLGLSMAYGAVKAHGGQMDIQSAPGRGTTVAMTFPAVAPQVASAAPRSPEPAPHEVGLRVLVADDDEPVQRAMKLLFGRLGHVVEVVDSGEAALARLAGDDAVDLLVLDLNMPGLGGAGTLERTRAVRPELPVLLCTGLADDRAMELSRSFPAVGLLAKPFDAKELAAALRQFHFTRA